MIGSDGWRVDGLFLTLDSGEVQADLCIFNVHFEWSRHELTLLCAVILMCGSVTSSYRMKARN